MGTRPPTRLGSRGAWPTSPSRSRSTSRSRPSASARSGPTSRTSGTRAGCTASPAARELRIEPAAGGVDVEPLDAETEPVARKLLGAEFDLDGVLRVGRGGADPVLKRLVVAARGFRPPLAPDPFETLVTSITAQQVSLFAAFAIRNRLIERFGVPRRPRLRLPDRGRARRRDRGRDRRDRLLAAQGRVRARARARRPRLGRASRRCRTRRSTRSSQAIRGIGEWTVDWFLARHLARPRAWPAGDLGLRKAVEAFYADGATLTTAEVRAMGARFEPFQNLTAHYLLTGLRVAGA